MMSYKKRVILVGAGHAHLHVAQNGRLFRYHNIDLTLIDPGRFWYSGLATGMLGGQYGWRQDSIDPKRLATKNGGTYIEDKVVSIDIDRNQAILESGDTLSYNAISFNIGSVVMTEPFGPLPETCWTVKPISNLWRLREHLEERFQNQPETPIKILLIGGGPTGCEIAVNLAALARHHHFSNLDITIATQDERVLKSAPLSASRKMQKVLESSQIQVQYSTTIQQLTENYAVDQNNQQIPYDLVILAPGLVAPPIISQLGLPYERTKGLKVMRTLQSITHSNIFAVGDCAHLEGHDLPKLGVFSVRQAPVLKHNLLALCTYQPLKTYHPQSKYLSILNLGGEEALMLWGVFSWKGRVPMKIKNRLDISFLKKYRQ